jgi:hypothetical protein
MDGNVYRGEFIMIDKEDLMIDSQAKHKILSTRSTTKLSSFFDMFATPDCSQSVLNELSTDDRN